MKEISWKEVYSRLYEITSKYENNTKYYGVPRGGSIVAGLTYRPAKTPDEADVIIDDLIDSGKTMQNHAKYGKPFEALIDKRKEYKNKWIVFPWEKTENGEETIEDNVIRLLQYFGEDPNREGLKETPKRFIKFFDQFLNPPKWNCTTFEGEGYDEMIVQSNIPFQSLCEHHIAPFFGIGAIAYIPNKKIVGLSKLARTLETFSRRLQNQERITTQVAEFLMNELDPLGVAVQLKARHMCMEMRGVKKHDTFTTTTKLLGVFKDKQEVRSEFLNSIK